MRSSLLYQVTSLLEGEYGFIKTREVLNMTEKEKQKRAVVSVVGKDQVGIIAKVTTVLAENNINVLDISQTILQDFFTMMMLVEVKELSSLDVLRTDFERVSSQLGLKINIQLEDIFQSMHRV